MNYQLELVSSHGDETFASLRYVACGLASAGEAGAILERGLSAPEGRASVSGSLAYALVTAKDGGRIVIMRRPAQPHLGYAAFTTAVIDRNAHTVTGNPLGYANGRNELGWYTESYTEAARQSIESTNGVNHSLIVPGGYMVGWLDVTPGLVMALSKLEVAVTTLAAIDLNFVEQAVTEALTLTPSFTQSSVDELAHSLVVSTVETTVVSHLRRLRWQGLALLGYSLSENGQPIAVQAAASLDEQSRTLDRLEAQLKAKSLLVGGLAWLAPHATTAIAIMRTELNDSLPEGSK